MAGDDQIVKDLDLEQMFEVFDAADKGKTLSSLPPKRSDSDKGGVSDNKEGAGSNGGVIIGLIAALVAGGFFIINH